MAESNVPQFVTVDTMIGEAVMRYPVTAEIMMSYGLHCVGCHVSGVESIQQGARGHGAMDDEDIDMLIQEMNEAIAQRESATQSGSPLTITKNAAKKIHEFAEQEDNQEGIFLRVGVTPSSHGGLSYVLDFEHEAKDDDIILEAQGFPVRMAKDSENYLRGTILDYIDGLNGAGFKFDNPNFPKG